MGTLSIFGFRALWSPYFLLAILITLLAYFLLTVKYRTRFANSEPLTKKQGIMFTAGILLLYIIKGGPIDLLGHLMFSAHMTQMAFLYYIIPSMFIIGTPQWVWRKLLSIKAIKLVFQFFTKPLLGLILFNSIFSIYHIPLIFDYVKTDIMLHASYTVVLFILAIFMWWPLVNQLEEYQTLSGLKKIGYIFAEGILLTPSCALIIFAETSIYETYSDPSAWAESLKLCVPSGLLSNMNLTGPEMFNLMSLVDDQQLGGVLMKIIQEIILGIILAFTFFEWARKDKEETDVELNQVWNDPS